MNKDYLKQYKEDAFENCPLLYGGAAKPCTENLMCFGWECGDGWYPVLRDLSYDIEALNIQHFYNYGVYAEASQVKEKFGGLRFYYDIQYARPWFRRIAAYPFAKLSRFISDNVKFKFAYVVDEDAYYETRLTEVGEDNVKKNDVVIEKDGKKFFESKVFHPVKSHRKLTNHHVLFFVRRLCDFAAYHVLNDFFGISRKTEVMSASLVHKVDELIEKAEKRCYDTCEICGVTIGNKYSKRVETKGWIRYICQKCDVANRIEEAYREARLMNSGREDEHFAEVSRIYDDYVNRTKSDSYVELEVYESNLKQLENAIATLRKSIDIKKGKK